MREIKFRGMSYGSKQWVYGFYAIIPSDGGIGSFIFDGEDWIEIIRESRGEYTGLKDKNGKEIYEGDVVSVYNYEESIVTKCEYKDACFTLTDSAGGGWTRQLCRQPERLEIIGNIYENAELLQPA